MSERQKSIDPAGACIYDFQLTGNSKKRPQGPKTFDLLTFDL